MMKISSVLLIIHSTLTLIGVQSDYCDSKYSCVKNGKLYQHLMCYSAPKEYECQIESLDASPIIEKVMLKLHNEVRLSITNEEYAKQYGLPKASNMSLLKWDLDLTWFSERWLTSCLLIPGECRATNKYKYVGQIWNSSVIEDPTKIRDPLDDIRTIFTNWINAFFTATDRWAIVGNYEDGIWFPGTQILWQKTAYIGCAFIGYSKPIAGDTQYHGLVCHYAPGGNINGEAVYHYDESSTSPSPTSSATEMPNTETPTVVPKPNHEYDYDYTDDSRISSTAHSSTKKRPIIPRNVTTSLNTVDPDDIYSESSTISPYYFGFLLLFSASVESLYYKLSIIL